MTPFGIVLVAGAVILVLAVFLERKRQARIYGPPSARPNLAGAGLLELQKHLHADRRVETLVEHVNHRVRRIREDGGSRAAEEVNETQPHTYALGCEELTGRRADYVEICNLHEGKSRPRAVDEDFIADVKT